MRTLAYGHEVVLGKYSYNHLFMHAISYFTTVVNGLFLKSIYFKFEMEISNLKKISNSTPRLFYKRGAKLGIFLQIANFDLKLIKNGLYQIFTILCYIICKKNCQFCKIQMLHYLNKNIGILAI